MPTVKHPSVANMKVNDRVLNQFVANLIFAHNLKLKGWISDVLQSDVLEHKIYEFAVRQAMEYCYYEVAKYDGREIAGHHFELELLSCDTIPQPPSETVNRPSLKLIVEKLMLCEMIKFPSFFPNALKKKLFFNMLLVMMTTLTVFLGASECDILGHKIAVTFTYLQEASKLLALKVQPGQSQIDPQSVTDFVESLLTRDKTWLPLSIERAIVTSVAIIILTIFEEVFVDFHVNLIGAVVQFHLAPGPKHLRILPIEEYRSRALAVRGRTAGKRSQTPIIAKSKEVSRGQYIDALNAKKYEAEKQIRDIDIKLVEQTRLTRLSLQKGMMSIIALALGYWKCLDNKENLVDVEVKPASQTSSYLEPGQRPGQGRMSELLQSSKHRVSALSKITKYVIPKSVKKKFAFSASTKKCETKEDLVRQDHGMQSRSKSK